jgi:CO/xanthine dehydrogenase Mo-binding subunit
MPGMLYGKVLRSQYPSAKILSIDTSETERLRGVKVVLTAKDVPRNETVTRVGQTQTRGEGFEGLYRVLADKKVHFMGEAVALVAAETEEIAEKALRMIQVKYQALPAVFDPVEAIKSDAPPVETGKSNIVTHYEVIKGNVGEGFSRADVIVENTYRVPFVDHAYLEPESGVAWMTKTGDHDPRLNQVIEHFRGGRCSEPLLNRVRARNLWGFGGKEISRSSFLAF